MSKKILCARTVLMDAKSAGSEIDRILYDMFVSIAIWVHWDHYRYPLYQHSGFRSGETIEDGIASER